MKINLETYKISSHFLQQPGSISQKTEGEEQQLSHGSIPSLSYIKHNQ